MLAGADNNQQQNRANTIIERVRNAYNNTGRIKKFINILLLISTIPPLFLLIQFFLYSWLVDYFLKPKENETRLLAWPKNIIRGILKVVLTICIIISCILLVLPMLFLSLLNQALIREIQQIFNFIQEVPEEERQFLV